MNEHETIADIIAEKRLRAAEMKKTLGDQHSFVESLKNDADRLEAAITRERGDAAKLREALKAAKRYLDGYTVNILEMRSTVDIALAAPARNCDRFGGDYKKLNALWFDWTGTPDGQNVDGTVKLTFAEWLLAPATEKEGGKVE